MANQARPAPWRRWTRNDLHMRAMYCFAAGFGSGLIYAAIIWSLTR